MDQGLIPRRYAKALYKFALEKGADRRLYELTGNLAKAFMAQPALQEAVTNPFVAAADKTELLTTAAGAGKDDAVFADFLKLLLHNNRIEFVRDIAIAYRDIYREEHDIYRVTVTSAQPLDAAEEQRLKALVEKHLRGGSMEYESRLDPELIGGFTVSVNNEKLDASVANELKQLRLKLITN